MAIVIKEIQVRTVVERDLSSKAIDETLIAKMKEEIYSQLKEELDRDMRRKRER